MEANLMSTRIYKHLDAIESPLDVKKIPADRLNELCSELRDFLVETVSKTGGHLASNLGVVELTVALHRVFDTSTDRLIFDVGHQCYVHMLLTGRKAGFQSLRRFGGQSGFPKPSESIHDAFVAGHASTSVSAALGIARARTLSFGDYSVIAVLGDGALTGGLAYEGLSDAGESREPLIVILNDNGMSIANNVGGVARYLARQRMKPSYAGFKKRYKRFMEFMPGGRFIYKIIHRTKTIFKEAILNCSIFEDMGLQYSGPIDGHNVQRIIEALEWAKLRNEPVLVHVLTKKGKGYESSEQYPEDYHAVNPFDPQIGLKNGEYPTFSAIFGEELVKIADEDHKICAITASMMAGTGLSGFAARFPKRFFDVGIAEGHAAVMAAGMAIRGATPVFAVYSTFLQRSYDMLIHDVAISGLHIVFAVDRAGLVSGDGDTHQGIFDIAFLGSIPGFTVFSPASYAELRDMLRYAIREVSGPVAVRYPRRGEGAYKGGGADVVKYIRTGRDFTLVTYGEIINTALEAAEMLEAEGISIEVIKLGRVIPVDTIEIEASVRRTKRLLVLEESSGRGCIGEHIAAAFLENSRGCFKEPEQRETGGAPAMTVPESFILLNTGDIFPPCGETNDLRKLCGIDAQGICDAIKKELKAP